MAMEGGDGGDADEGEIRWIEERGLAPVLSCHACSRARKTGRKAFLRLNQM
jgi:hypothetical protein